MKKVTRRSQGGLTGARAAVERQRNDGGEWWRRELNVGAEEGKRECKSEGRRCGLLRGALSLL
jgi:hypothetical protein